MYDLDFEIKDKYDIDDLLEVTRILRSENGCPWDREQDHKSVRMNVLEEAYEVMEAIDADDAAMLKEERYMRRCHKEDDISSSARFRRCKCQ